MRRVVPSPLLQRFVLHDDLLAVRHVREGMHAVTDLYSSPRIEVPLWLKV